MTSEQSVKQKLSLNPEESISSEKSFYKHVSKSWDHITPTSEVCDQIPFRSGTKVTPAMLKIKKLELP